MRARFLEIGRMDELGRADSPIHRLDPRAKILVAAAFIGVVVSFERHELSALAPLFLYPVALVAAARLPAGYLARKVAIAAPFAIAIGALNPFLDRAPVATPWGGTIAAGWLSFASILLKFALSVGAALILIASTGIYRVCAGLQRFRLPRAFILQVLFLYRYLFVVADEGFRMLRSVELRAPGIRSLPLRVYRSLLGSWLLRSIDRAHRIHRAMVARGFAGEIRTLERANWRAAESAFVGSWVAFFLLVRLWDLPEVVGSCLLGLFGGGKN